MSENNQPIQGSVKGSGDPGSGNPGSGFFGPQTRATFLGRAGTLLAGALSTAAGSSAVARAADNDTARQTDASEKTSGRQGKRGSGIKRWDVVTIGNLSRNRYWGESDAKAVRSVICTCTLIVSDGARILVDPSLADARQMKKELGRRAGLELDEIDAIFITHEHGDHFAGAAHFPGARWLAGPRIAKILNERRKLPKRVEPVTGLLFEAVDVIPTPGHTMGHCGLGFECGGLSIAVAGDAVMTKDFWLERRGYFNCVDFELSTRTMDKLAGAADIIVPGHDNYFLSGRGRQASAGLTSPPGQINS